MILKIRTILTIFLLVCAGLQVYAIPEDIQISGLRSKFYYCCNNDQLRINEQGYLPNYNLWRPKVAVVLSGGGTRGFAQVGVIKELIKAGIPIDYIAGTSIGSVVAGLYAVGYNIDELDSILSGAKWENIITFNDERSRSDFFLDQKIIRDRSLLNLRFKNFNFVIPEAISYGTMFNAFLQRLIWNGLYHDNGNFNTLKIPFRAVATDLISGETKMLKSGNLVTAIRASSSFPLRYTPVRIDSMVLVDGGLMANLPVSAVEEFNPDIIIAVNTISPLLGVYDLNKPWNIADQVVSILMKKFSDNALINADFIIEPELGDRSNTDFSDIDTLVKLGELSANYQMPVILKRYNFLTDSVLKYRTNIDFNKIQYINLSGFHPADSSALVKSIKSINPDKNEFYKLLLNYEKNDKYRELEIKSSDLMNETTLNIKASKFDSLNHIIIIGLDDNLNNELEYNLNEEFQHIELKPSTIELVTEKILRNLRSKGFSFAEIANIELDKEKGNLIYFLSQGIIRSIDISGNSTQDYLILRELNFSENQPANADKILDSWENINSLDYISDVEIILLRKELGDSIDIIIKTTDIGDQAIRIGGRVDNERLTQLGIDFIQENFLNQGSRLSLRFAGGLRNQNLIFKSENTRIFETFLTSAMSFYYDTKKIYFYNEIPTKNRNSFEFISTGEYREERFGIKALFGAQIERKGTFSGEFRYEKQRYFDLDNNKLTEFKNLFTVKIGTIFDTEDLADFPTEGRVIDLSLETPLFKGNDFLSFSKVQFMYHSNHSIKGLTLRPSLFFGFADITTPLPEFFSMGGQSMFYGMREDEARGRQIAIGSIDYRYKLPFYIFFETYLSIRYDIGSVWENLETIKISSLRHGIGSCLAFDTPLGAAKFSVGRSFYFLKDPNAVAWGKITGYFSIGMRL